MDEMKELIKVSMSSAEKIGMIVAYLNAIEVTRLVYGTRDVKSHAKAIEEMLEQRIREVVKQHKRDTL
jgi:hypothetical protein